MEVPRLVSRTPSERIEAVVEGPTKKRKVAVESTKGKLDDMARALYNALSMAGPKGTAVHISGLLHRAVRNRCCLQAQAVHPEKHGR